MRCHGRDTLPGVRLNCRGTGAEAAVYGAVAGAVAAPAGGAGRRGRRAVALRRRSACARCARRSIRRASTSCPTSCARFAEGSRAAAGEHALVASRLAPEKGVDARGAGLRAGGPRRSWWPATARRPARCARPAARASSAACRPTSWPTCAPARRWRSCPRARPRPSAWRRPRRWPPACRSWPPRSARCPSSSAPTGSWRRATPTRSPPPRGRASATRTPAAPGCSACARSPRPRSSPRCSPDLPLSDAPPFDRGRHRSWLNLNGLGAAWPPLIDALSGLVLTAAAQGITPAFGPPEVRRRTERQLSPGRGPSVRRRRALARDERLRSVSIPGGPAAGPSCGIRFGMPAPTPQEVYRMARRLISSFVVAALAALLPSVPVPRTFMPRRRRSRRCSRRRREATPCTWRPGPTGRGPGARRARWSWWRGQRGLADDVGRQLRSSVRNITIRG